MSSVVRATLLAVPAVEVREGRAPRARGRSGAALRSAGQAGQARLDLLGLAQLAVPDHLAPPRTRTSRPRAPVAVGGRGCACHLVPELADPGRCRASCSASGLPAARRSPGPAQPEGEPALLVAQLGSREAEAAADGEEHGRGGGQGSQHARGSAAHRAPGPRGQRPGGGPGARGAAQTISSRQAAQPRGARRTAARVAASASP